MIRKVGGRLPAVRSAGRRGIAPGVRAVAVLLVPAPGEQPSEDACEFSLLGAEVVRRRDRRGAVGVVHWQVGIHRSRSYL
jgi:hypothetical protein